MDTIKGTLKLNEKEAEKNIIDFLDSIEQMGITLVDEYEGETPNREFVIEQYFATFNK